MMIVMTPQATEEQVAKVCERLRSLGLDIHRSTGRSYTVLGAIGDPKGIDKRQFELMEGVKEVAEVARWPALQRGVAKALVDYRSLGVCCSFGEWQKDINAIAVTVRPGSNLPPMAISCGGPAFSVSPEFLLDEVRPRLIALATSLEVSIGTKE